MSETADARRAIREGQDFKGRIAGPTERGAERFGRHQGWIALGVVVVYVVLIAMIALSYVAAAVWPSLAQLSAAADRIKDLVNTLVLQIVTLVLGYYFGKRAE